MSRHNAKSTLGVLFDESNKIAKDILLDEPKNNNWRVILEIVFLGRSVKRALPLSPVPLSKGTRTHTFNEVNIAFTILTTEAVNRFAQTASAKVSKLERIRVN